MSRTWMLKLTAWAISTAALLCGCSDGVSSRQELAPPRELGVIETEAPAASASNAHAETSGEHAEALTDARLVEAVSLSVNGRAITATEIINAVDPQLRQAATEAADEVAFLTRAGGIISDVIAMRVNQLLLAQEARRHLRDEEIAFLEGRVAKNIQNQILASGGSKLKYESDLAALGLTPAEMRSRLSDEMVGRYYLQQKVQSRLSFSRDAMLRYYDNHPDLFSTKAAVSFRVMAFPYSVYLPKGIAPTAEMRQQAVQKAMAAAQEALNKVAMGKDFTELIKDDSPTTLYLAETGGLWEMLTPGSFREQVVEQAAFDQPVGQISQPIEGQTGVFLVQTVARREADVKSFEQAQADIQARLTESRHNQLMRDLLIKMERSADIRHRADFDTYLMTLALEKYFRK